MFGAGGGTSSYDGVAQADVIVLWGSNARNAHPIFFHHVLTAVHRGAKLFVVDPRRTATAQWADLWLGPEIGTDILDVMMPVLDGLSACRRLRARRDRTPVLILTARSEVPDRVSGLDAGADDYLAKPFDLEELFARLRALLRRTRDDDDSAVRAGDVVLDPAARRAWRGDRELDLSKTEFELLELLLRNAGIVLQPSAIYERIWGYDFGPDSKNLAVYIGYLRRKLEGPEDSKLIHTVRGVGYTVRVS